MTDLLDASLRNAVREIQTCIVTTLNNSFEENPLSLSVSHPIGHKTVSEVGGRFIEDYVIASLESIFENDNQYTVHPTSSRSLGDFVVEEQQSIPHRIYFDVKAQHLTIREKTYELYKEKQIDAKKPGESHPNLISFDKARNFYSDTSRSKEDIAFVMIHYDPVIIGKEVKFNLQPLNLDSIFLLRDIGDQNLSFGNLGKGQVQLKRIGDIQLKRRSKKEFINFVTELASKPRSKRATSTA